MGTLNYQPPQRRRRRIVVRAAIAVVIAGALVVAFGRIQSTWPYVKAWWAYSPCTNHRFVDGQVAFDLSPGAVEAPGASTAVLTLNRFRPFKPNGMFSRAEMLVAVCRSGPWVGLLPHLDPNVGLSNTTTVFLHERQTPAGETFLVYVGLDAAYGCPLLQVHTIAPPTLKALPLVVESYANLHIDCDNYRSLKIMTGQPDPADPTRFTIAYAWEGKPGVIEGKLVDSRAVVFTPDIGLTERANHFDTWSPDRPAAASETPRRGKGLFGGGDESD